MADREPDGAEEFYNLVETLESKSDRELGALIKPFLAIRNRENREIANQKIHAQIALSVLLRRIDPLKPTRLDPADGEMPF